MPRQNQILWVTGSAVQPSAGLPSSHSFHGEVCRSGRLLLSIPLVQLCAAHTPNRAVLASAPLGSAPLRRLTAPPSAPSLANYETNVFYWPAKAQFQPLEANPKCPGTRQCRSAVRRSSILCLNRCSIPMEPLNCSKSIPKPCSAWRGGGKSRAFKSASFGGLEDRS
jgi:hypothetical protein